MTSLEGMPAKLEKAEHASDDGKLEVPFMPKPDFIHRKANLRDTIIGHDTVFRKSHNGKIIYYDHERLLTWKAMFALGGSVFSHRNVWSVGFYVAALAFVVAFAVAHLLPSARKLDTKKFTYFVTFLKIFISFMLGGFIDKCFNRWWSSVSTFKRFLVGIKQLMFTLYATKVDPDMFMTIERYCIASSYLLNTEVHNAQTMQTGRENAMFKIDQTFDFLVENDLLTEKERSMMESVRHETDCQLGVMTMTVWTWIGEMMSQVKREAGGASISPPMHVRLLVLCQDALAQVENLKTNLVVQIPFAYAHLLAFLVHLNNTLLGISCGLSIGSAVSEAMSRHETAAETGGWSTHLVKEYYGAMQVVGIQVLVVLVEPMLYMAFLHIAHSLAYPYGDEQYHLPMETFIAQLHIELVAMEKGRRLHKERVSRLSLAAHAFQEADKPGAFQPAGTFGKRLSQLKQQGKLKASVGDPIAGAAEAISAQKEPGDSAV